jgi:O-antigen/teichoic acid export membrane protein
VVSIPIALVIGVGADVWVRLAFKDGFDESAMALAAFAPTFVLTYTAMILSIALVILDKQWITTRVSLTALVLNPVFIVIMVPIVARLGEGGAAAGAASAAFLSELVVSLTCLHYVGSRALDSRTVLAAVKSIAIAIGVIVMDHYLRPQFPRPYDWVRIPIDMAVYALAAVAIGAIRIKEAMLVVNMVRQRRRGAEAAA